MSSLPRGRHGLSPEFVAQDQLGRLLEAIAGCLHEQGYGKTTVSAITKRARVSKSDFYRHFSSKDECFLAAYDEAAQRLRDEASLACAHCDAWEDGVLAALAAVLAYLSENPARADLLLVEGLRVGPSVYERFQGTVGGFVEMLSDRAPKPAGAASSPGGVDEAVVGGIASLLSRWVLAGKAEGVQDFLPEVAEFALTPYLGSVEARRIVSAR